MSIDTVLLVTTSYDVAPKYVGRALDRRGVPYFRLDTDRFPTEIRSNFDPHGELTIIDDDCRVSAKKIKSVWYRRSVKPNLPVDLKPGVRDFCERECRAFLEGVLATLQTKRWLSDPQAIRNAERKPYQLSVAARLGFILPATVVTNDGEAARSFAERHRVVAKAVSSGYISEPDGVQAVFTSSLTPGDLDDLSGLSLAPVTFQEHISKASDIRVTVVEDEVYAAEIRSQDQESSRVDWRAAQDANLEHMTHELPLTVANRCRRLVSCLGLVFGAIDLALTTDGRYIFFEINPNGEWVWIEDQLGFPISDSIAAWLNA